MSCCRSCDPIVRQNVNNNTIFKTISIVPGTAVTSFVVPNCVKRYKIFYFQVAQTLPTTSLPAEIQYNCTQYPLVNACGEAVLTSQLKEGFVYAVASVEYSLLAGTGCSYELLTPVCVASTPTTGE